MHATTRITNCGHVCVFFAQGGRLFRGASCLVALKMWKVVAIIARTIRLQLKLTPRSTNLAILTLTLIFCKVVNKAQITNHVDTYQILRLLLFCDLLVLLQHLLFPESWA